MHWRIKFKILIGAQEAKQRYQPQGAGEVKETEAHMKFAETFWGVMGPHRPWNCVCFMFKAILPGSSGPQALAII